MSNLPIFFSYSRSDHHFAELAKAKLAEKQIKLWIDQGGIRAGEEWSQSIENALSESLAVIVVLSKNSVDSKHVSYEWAYSLGKGKVLIPLRLDSCSVHPRLAIIHQLDFSIPGNLPWKELIDRIEEIEVDKNVEDKASIDIEVEKIKDDILARNILAYLNERGYQMASFERLRKKLNENTTDEQFKLVIEKYPGIFRRAKLSGGRLGLAKRIP